MSDSFEQYVLFSGGPNDGRHAKAAFRKPFDRTATVVIDGEYYDVAEGPISQLAEKTQESVDFGAFRLRWKSNVGGLPRVTDDGQHEMINRIFELFVDAKLTGISDQFITFVSGFRAYSVRTIVGRAHVIELKSEANPNDIPNSPFAKRVQDLLRGMVRDDSGAMVEKLGLTKEIAKEIVEAAVNTQRLDC